MAYVFAISFVAAVGGFLYGYDGGIIIGANLFLREQFQLSDVGWAFASTSMVVGAITGPFLGAWVCDRFGRKNTFIIASVLFSVSAVFTAIPRDIVTFNIFRFVGGVGVGLCSIASPMYIAEVAPPRIRGALGILYQLALVVGALCSLVVSYFLAQHLPESVSWRWMFFSETGRHCRVRHLSVFHPQEPQVAGPEGPRRAGTRNSDQDRWSRACEKRAGGDPGVTGSGNRYLLRAASARYPIRPGYRYPFGPVQQPHRF